MCNNNDHFDLNSICLSLHITFFTFFSALPIVGSLTLSIDSDEVGNSVTLTEGVHRFDCFGTTTRPDAVIIWTLGNSIIPPNVASIPGVGGGTISSQINDLELTEENDGDTVTCAVVSWRNPSLILESISATLDVNGKFENIVHKIIYCIFSINQYRCHNYRSTHPKMVLYPIG